MKKNVRITKREIKEDKFTTLMLLGKDYIMAHWLYLVAGLGVILLVIAGVSLLKSQKGKSETEAADIFNRALNETRSTNYQLAIVDFKKIIDDYGSSSQADMAAFNLANAYLANKNYTEARAAFESYLKRSVSDKYFITSAIAGVGACLAGSGDLAAAAEKYREAAEKFPDFKMAGDYYVKAMQNYAKAGNLEMARKMFAQINKEYTGTSFYIEGQRLAGEYNIQ
jgi:TolA-binding protein